jgi:hypothetical protein
MGAFSLGNVKSLNFKWFKQIKAPEKKPDKPF